MHNINYENINKMLDNVNEKIPIIPIICGICGKTRFIDARVENLLDILKNEEWQTVEDKIYCKECHDQFINLTNIVNTTRPTKHNYYLNIAKEVSTRSTCLRKRYGSVIVKNDIIISTGYNGAPRQTKNCIDLNYCRREQMNIPRGQCYELCRSVHSEMNAIINAEREKMIDSTLYLYGSDTNGNIVENLDSCQLCKKIIINAGIKRVIFARPKNLFVIQNVKDWIENDETLTEKMGY